MSLKIDEKVPKHFAHFVKASFELESLQEAHFTLLEKRHKAATFPDSETVFMRAGITLLCSAWEAYVEDLARNALSFLIENCKCADDLPLEVRKNIAKELKDDKNDLSPWTLAGDGWRTAVKTRFETNITKKANTLNTPKSSNVKALYADMVGIDDITECWKWEMFDSKGVCEIIDHLVAMRGNIAHGRPCAFPAVAIRMVYLKSIVSQCACLMNNHIRDRLNAITGKEPWALVRFTQDWTQFCKTDAEEKETNNQVPRKA